MEKTLYEFKVDKRPNAALRVYVPRSSAVIRNTVFNELLPRCGVPETTVTLSDMQQRSMISAYMSVVSNGSRTSRMDGSLADR